MPLGVVEGTLENGAVCRRLGSELRERGDASQGVLFVIDGGKAGNAVEAVFGTQAVTQRGR